MEAVDQPIEHDAGEIVGVSPLNATPNAGRLVITLKPRNERRAGVVAIVREAEAAQRRVHACGSRWSFSDCAVTGDYLIDTRRLYRPLQSASRSTA